MSRQDRATTERNARTLRELVKRPENKVCADCKKNDPRWASWNLGVYLCIRCSGIHRGMGTHISKVKSIDLDTWTPEQMESIQKWGNHRANLYWEAHLKPGHIPPEHKMESFIRSKYESKRWAKEGPPPSDPSVLESGAPSASAAPVPQRSPPPQAAPATTRSPQTTAAPARASARQPQTHQLLSSNFSNATQSPPARSAAASGAQPAAPAAQPQQPAAPANDLFSLDFHAPATSTPVVPEQQAAPKKDVKQDILSLFSAPPPAQAPGAQFGQFSGAAPMAGGQNVWGAAAPAAQQVPTSMMGNNGVGAWGASSGWNAPANMAPQSNLWGGAAAQPAAPANNLFNTSDVWGSTAAGSTQQNDLFGSFGSAAPAPAQKKDDAFGDLWGGFK